jgi:hypothetical protein
VIARGGKPPEGEEARRELIEETRRRLAEKAKRVSRNKVTVQSAAVEVVAQRVLEDPDLLMQEDIARILTQQGAEQRELQQDIDRILARLDAEMPEAQKEMDDLLARLRITRIMVAA